MVRNSSACVCQADPPKYVGRMAQAASAGSVVIMVRLARSPDRMHGAVARPPRSTRLTALRGTIVRGRPRGSIRRRWQSPARDDRPRASSRVVQRRLARRIWASARWISPPLPRWRRSHRRVDAARRDAKVARFRTFQSPRHGRGVAYQIAHDADQSSFIVQRETGHAIGGSLTVVSSARPALERTREAR